MERQSHEDLAHVATLYGDAPRHEPMSREERLRRWAWLLKQHPDRTLETLYETEFESAEVRDAMRADGTAISVAFEDPLLRADGLADDTYGEAKRFFDLPDGELHRVVCYCYNGTHARAGMAAWRLEDYMRSLTQTGWLHRVLRALSPRL